MTKGELRTKYKALRKALSMEDIDTLSMAIANKLLNLDIWHYDYYHIFLPIEEQKEINTEFILNILNGKDKSIIIPKSDFTSLTMKNILLTDSTLIKKNDYNIPEPIGGLEIDKNLVNVVFIPLLAYDNRGNRVGYGKGFYDRFLKACSKDILKIGLSFFEPESNLIQTTNMDIKLNYCVTPRQVHRF